MQNGLTILIATIVLFILNNIESSPNNLADGVTRATTTSFISYSVSTNIVHYDSNSMESLKKPHPAHQIFFNASHNTMPLNREEMNKIGARYGFPNDLFFYQNKKESGGGCALKPNAKYALGCFQFLKGTAEEFGLIVGGVDYRTNFYASNDTAARYLKWILIVLFKEQADPQNWTQLRYALASYNAGYNKVLKDGRLSIPDYYETKSYIMEIESLVRGNAYWVERGDTLSLISRKTGVPVSAILKGNIAVTGAHDLIAGTVLLLPDESHGMTKVLVKRGMSLFYISRRTGVSVSKLIAANNLSKKGGIQANVTLNIPTEFISI